MAKEDRFEKVYSQGTLNVTEIWVDRETGVNYVFHQGGYAGGLTPLLGGKEAPAENETPVSDASAASAEPAESVGSN